MRLRRFLQIVGSLDFMAGLMLALAAGIIIPGNPIVVLSLVIMGIIVGVLNISNKDTITLMVAAVAIVVVGTAGFAPLDQLVDGLGSTINEIVNYLARFMAPAAIITAARALLSVGFPKYY